MALAPSMKTTILFLASNPDGMSKLALDEESRSIREKVRASGNPNELDFETEWAVRPDDLLQYLNEYRPQVVHFSGHGSATEELVLRDQNGRPKHVSKAALRSLFMTLRDNIRLVVLNACYSRPQAEAIIEVIDCAVGMKRQISDAAAITFAAAFYRALGFGRSVKEAFDQGITALMLEGIPEDSTPDLLVKPGIDPSRVYLIGPSGAPLPHRGPGNDYAPSSPPPGYSSGPPAVLAVEVWQEKLAFLERKAAIASDPAQQFQLEQQIKEAKAKIAELGQAATKSPAKPESVRPPSSSDTQMVSGGSPPTPPRKDQRRIDAAAPGQVALGETFDVLVQVKLPDSPPLTVEDWPRKTRPESVETRSEPVNLEFPVDPVTGKAIPPRLLFKVVAPDCKIEGAPEKTLDVPVDGDSTRLTFLLRPTKKGVSRIDIEVYSVAKDYLGTVPIETAVDGVPAEKIATVGSLVVVVVERKTADTGTSANKPPPPPPPPSAPAPAPAGGSDAPAQHSPMVRLSNGQMLGLFVFTALLGAGSYFIHPIVSAVFLSLAVAIGTFGFLSAVAHVENAYGKFGGSAGVAIACLLILLKMMPGETQTADPTDFVGTVYVDGQPATAGVIRLLETGWADNTRNFSEGNPGTFEFKGLPAVGTNMTLQIDVNAPIDLPSISTNLPFSPGTRLRIELRSPGSHITGRVKDSAGNPVAGARVSANGRVALTYADGWFALTNLTVPFDGLVELKIDAAGLESFAHRLKTGFSHQIILRRP